MSERVHFQEPAHRLFPAFVGLPHRVAEIHPSTRRETGHHLTRIGPRASRDLIGGRAYLRCRAYSAALIGFRLPRRRTAASPVGAKSDASFFQRKAPPKRTEKYQTVVYDSIKVPYRGSHHARPYFSTLLKSQFEKCQKLNGYLIFALRASQKFWPIRVEKGELQQQQPGIARMSCARMDIKSINRRRRSVGRVHAPRFEAGRDFTWTR